MNPFMTEAKREALKKELTVLIDREIEHINAQLGRIHDEQKEYLVSCKEEAKKRSDDWNAHAAQVAAHGKQIEAGLAVLTQIVQQQAKLIEILVQAQTEKKQA